MKVHAPSSVALQFRTLSELKVTASAPIERELLDELLALFDRDAIIRRLTAIRDTSRTISDESACFTPPAVEWVIRCAGIRRFTSTIEMLGDIGCSNDLQASLAAERSLSDFTSPEANRALARVVAGWRYDASIRAARTLKGRDPELLRTTLIEAPAPEKYRYWSAVLFAELNDPRAVPLLCETVTKIHIMDREMFKHLARLATADQRELVLDVSMRARPDQQEDARRMLRDFERRVSE